MLQDLKFADSLDPERRVGEYSYVELADPPEGERGAGWPRLLIENRAYCTRAFRKLHLELAARQDGLQVRKTLAVCACMTLHPGKTAYS